MCEAAARGQGLSSTEPEVEWQVPCEDLEKSWEVRMGAVAELPPEQGSHNREESQAWLRPLTTVQAILTRGTTTTAFVTFY